MKAKCGLSKKGHFPKTKQEQASKTPYGLTTNYNTETW